MSGGGSSQTSKTEPWEGLKPYLSDVYSQAQKLYQGGNPYQSQFVGMNPGQQNALSAIYAKGMTPSALMGSAGSYAQNQMDTGGNWAGSPAMPALMNIGYGGMVPTGFGQYGGGMTLNATQGPSGSYSTGPSGLDYVGSGAVTDALSKWGKINATDTGTLNAARPEIVGTGFTPGSETFGVGRFNDAAYLAANPDLTPEALGGMTAAQHYDQFGAGEKRDLGINSTTAGAISPEEQLQLATNLIRLGGNDAGYVDAYMKEVADTGGFNPFAGLTEAQLTEALQGQNKDGSARAAAPASVGGYQVGGGGFGSGNPFLDATFANAAFPVVNQFMTATAPTVDAAFSRAGRYGSGAQATAQNNAADTLMRNLGGLATGIYGGAYESERNRQMQGLGMMQGAYDTGQSRALTAAGMAPGLENAQMNNYLQAFNAAGQYQNQDRARLADRQMLAMAPYSWLQNYAGILNGMPSGFGTTTTTGGGGNNAFGMGMQGLGTAIQLAALFGASSRTLKDIVAPVDPDAILEKVAGLDVGRWAYKPVTPHSVTMPGEHIGPYAEDFQEAFGVGDGYHINLLDAVGVLFGAVKALAARVKELEAERV